MTRARFPLWRRYDTYLAMTHDHPLSIVVASLCDVPTMCGFSTARRWRSGRNWLSTRCRETRFVGLENSVLPVLKTKIRSFCYQRTTGVNLCIPEIFSSCRSAFYRPHRVRENFSGSLCACSVESVTSPHSGDDEGHARCGCSRRCDGRCWLQSNLSQQ